MDLPRKLLAVHAALDRAGVPHAFGGAIALAYWTLDPRGTADIDLNLFVPATEPRVALDALPQGVERPDGAEEQVRGEGQARLWWDGTPLDLFFDYVPLHAAAARRVRSVPFAGAEIPVLGPVDLAVFKAMFDRTRDWADIEAMLAARTLDADAVREALGEMLEPGDPRFARLREAERLAGG